jgi:hypothetical protein
MTNQHPITPPPPHLLKKFSAQAQAEANKRNGTGYLKTVATLCIEWFVNSQSTSNDRQIRSSEIEPPPELVAKLWREASAGRDDAPIGEIFNHGVYLAYAAGADQELEACVEWLDRNSPVIGGFHLRIDRRPKPPSLKEQALLVIDTAVNDYRMSSDAASTIRRALEALDD